MGYSEEFKDAVLERLLAKEISIKAASTEYQVSKQTLRNWRDKMLAGNMGFSLTKKGAAVKRLSLPKNISYLQAYDAVVMLRVASDTAFGKYCRQQGITRDQVLSWKQWFAEHPNACNTEELSASREVVRDQQKQLVTLGRKMEKQQKALAETATMLMLSKKAQAILGGKES